MSVCPSVTSAVLHHVLWSFITYHTAVQCADLGRETSGLATKVAVYTFCDPWSIAVAVTMYVLWTGRLQSLCGLFHRLVRSHTGCVCHMFSVLSLYKLWRLCVTTARRVSDAFSDRTFQDVGPRIWNSMPASLRHSDTTVGQFKKLLKTHLFS